MLRVIMICLTLFLAAHNIVWVLIAEERRRKYDRLWDFMIGKRKDI